MAYYIPTISKSGGTRPPCSPPNCALYVCDVARCSFQLSFLAFAFQLPKRQKRRGCSNSSANRPKFKRCCQQYLFFTSLQNGCLWKDGIEV